MIGKIKGVMELEKKMDDLTSKAKNSHKSIQDQSKTVEELRQEVASLKKELDRFNKAAVEYHVLLDNHTQEFTKLKKAVEEELYELKLVKTHFQTKLVDEILVSFKEELQKQTKKLDTDVQNYNELKEKLAAVTSDVSSVSSEVRRFTEIASKIKEADFEMAQYAREVTKTDREKLNLMKEVDRLQKLISAERRKNRR